MNPHPLIPLVALLALIYAVIRMLGADGEPVQLDSPGWDGRPVNAVTVQLPPIRDFEHYYPNDKNPFVPIDARGREERALKKPPAERPKEVFEPFTTPDEQPRVIEKPAFVAPRADTTISVPEVVGILRLGKRARVSLVIDDTLHALQIGESAAGWTLTGIEQGAVLVRSADSETVRLPPPATAENQVDLAAGAAPAPPSTGAGGGGLPDDIEPPKSEDPVVQKAIDEIARNPAAIFKYRQDEELWKRIEKDPSVQEFMKKHPDLVEMLER